MLSVGLVADGARPTGDISYYLLLSHLRRIVYLAITIHGIGSVGGGILCRARILPDKVFRHLMRLVISVLFGWGLH